MRLYTPLASLLTSTNYTLSQRHILREYCDLRTSALFWPQPDADLFRLISDLRGRENLQVVLTGGIRLVGNKRKCLESVLRRYVLAKEWNQPSESLR